MYAVLDNTIIIIIQLSASMPLLRVIVNTVALLTLLVVADEQIPLGDSSPRDPPRVAIVGAGITGASTAFRLQEITYPYSLYSVTIFERESSIGGRVKPISPSLHDHAVLEAGATHFFADDWCVVNA